MSPSLCFELTLLQTLWCVGGVLVFCKPGQGGVTRSGQCPLSPGPHTGHQTSAQGPATGSAQAQWPPCSYREDCQGADVTKCHLSVGSEEVGGDTGLTVTQRVLGYFGFLVENEWMKVNVFLSIFTISTNLSFLHQFQRSLMLVSSSLLSVAWKDDRKWTHFVWQ